MTSIRDKYKSLDYGLMIYTYKRAFSVYHEAHIAYTEAVVREELLKAAVHFEGKEQRQALDMVKFYYEELFSPYSKLPFALTEMYVDAFTLADQLELSGYFPSTKTSHILTEHGLKWSSDTDRWGLCNV